ncbi:MAG: hypothetical protein M3Q69_10045 [Acidobacteriota bacterium]|nr:hypothetical protein [Acidobacteriota bacterium]
MASERHQPYGLTMTVSGFAAHTILAREHGLHVLELQDGHTTTRINARVRVATDVAALASASGMRSSCGATGMRRRRSCAIRCATGGRGGWRWCCAARSM